MVPVNFEKITQDTGLSAHENLTRITGEGRTDGCARLTPSTFMSANNIGVSSFPKSEKMHAVALAVGARKKKAWFSPSLVLPQPEIKHRFPGSYTVSLLGKQAG